MTSQGDKYCVRVSASPVFVVFISDIGPPSSHYHSQYYILHTLESTGVKAEDSISFSSHHLSRHNWCESPPPSAMTLGIWILYLLGSFIGTNGLGKWRELTQFRNNFLLLLFPQIWQNSERLQSIWGARIVLLSRFTVITPRTGPTSRNLHSTPTSWSRSVTV